MLNPIYDFVARAIVDIHGVLVHIIGSNGWSWALSIVLLVMAVRLVMFPLFVKQIRSQRTMQLMQPKIKELKEKYKNDKQRLNEEMLKLQKEHGNPLLGCLPIFLQIPLFISLFRVMNGFAPHKGSLSAEQAAAAVQIPGKTAYYPVHLNGLSVPQAYQIAHAKIFGASIATSLTSGKSTLAELGGSATPTRILCVILIIVMMSSTYITQRQIMGRNPQADSQQAATQKILLYLSPLFLGVFGFRFSIGVLLYWFTTNLWSMGQQFFVIRRMPPVIAPGAATTATAAYTPPGAFVVRRGLLGRRQGTPELPPATPAAPPRVIQQRPLPASGADTPRAKVDRTGSAARAGRPPARRKKTRRGGRH